MEGLHDFLKEQINELAFTEVSNEESLVESGLLDSIVVVDLVVAIEEEYDVHIPNSDVIPEHFESINHIVAYLEKQ